ARDEVERFKEVGGMLIDVPKGSTGFGPLDDLVGDSRLIDKVIGETRFAANGCGRHYDTELLAPHNALYCPYQHDLTDLFPGMSTTPTTTFPMSLAPVTFRFSVPGSSGTVGEPVFDQAATRATTVF